MKSLQRHFDTAAFHIRKSLAGAVLLGVLIGLGMAWATSGPYVQVIHLQGGWLQTINHRTGEMYRVPPRGEMAYVGNLYHPKPANSPAKK
jgi:hypothetical protein